MWTRKGRRIATHIFTRVWLQNIPRVSFTTSTITPALLLVQATGPCLNYHIPTIHNPNVNIVAYGVLLVWDHQVTAAPVVRMQTRKVIIQHRFLAALVAFWSRLLVEVQTYDVRLYKIENNRSTLCKGMIFYKTSMLGAVFK